MAALGKLLIGYCCFPPLPLPLLNIIEGAEWASEGGVSSADKIDIVKEVGGREMKAVDGSRDKEKKTQFFFEAFLGDNFLKNQSIEFYFFREKLQKCEFFSAFFFG